MPSLNLEKEKQVFFKHYDSQRAVFEDAANSLGTLVSLLLTDNDAFSTPKVTSRVKKRDECISKFERKYLPTCEKEKKLYSIQDYITDIVGLRVICLYEEDISSIRAVMDENFEIIEESDKSQELASQEEDIFGYKGLHLDLKLLQNRRDLPEYKRFRDIQFEVQLRTIVQDAWSVLDHKIKYKKSIPRDLKRRINRLAALFELADQEFLNIHKETKRLETTAKKEAATAPVPAAEPKKPEIPAPLNAISFQVFAENAFPGYPFQGHKIDGFVAEILRSSPDLSLAALEVAFKKHENTIQDYRDYQNEKYLHHLNPYTTLRHVLFMEDEEHFDRLLFESQKTAFRDWLKSNRR